MPREPCLLDVHPTGFGSFLLFYFDLAQKVDTLETRQRQLQTKPGRCSEETGSAPNKEPYEAKRRSILLSLQPSCNELHGRRKNIWLWVKTNSTILG